MSLVFDERRPNTVAPQPTEAVDPDRFDTEALARYLDQRGQNHGRLYVQRFTGARSNPTFLIDSGDHADRAQFVLRQHASPASSGSAGRLEREYRVMAALAATPSVPVPAVQGYCADESVLGGAFYLMDYVPGRTLDDPRLAALPTEQRGGVYRGMVDTLAALHEVDVAEVGLTGFGPVHGHLARQAASWQYQYEQAVGTPDPAMAALGDWLVVNMPAGTAPTITHGDFRLANLMFAADRAELAAVLDWELATLGHPLADLAYACLPYYLPDDMELLPGMLGLNLTAWGIPDESELLARYRSIRGLPPIEGWPVFIAYALFGMAALAQTAQARAFPGEAHSEQGLRVAQQVGELAELGWQMARYHQTAC
ncbi:phosphotransferase family protein [Salinisphaera sp. SPP-AMP-43]|uniref:phosphotransferase family protein n=1 Tax=Salinisphaera sp. SPP-AMP-43 TaxID=3121288 RepID=UPI003C6E4223